MDMIRLGQNLQILRKEKGLTQEQLAERFNVSRRTVSRWETGTNMPDIDILLDLSEFYDVDLRGLLDGERLYGETENDVRETVLKIAEYSTRKSVRYTKTYKLVGLITLVLLLAANFIRGFTVLGMITVWPYLYLCILIAACVFAAIGSAILQIENRRMNDAMRRIAEKLMR